MLNIFTFTRINTYNTKYTEEQVEGIATYIKENDIIIYHNIEVIIDTPNDEKNILDFLKSCQKNSVLIAYDLNVFGRTIENILEIIKILLEHKVKIIIIKQNLELIDEKDVLTQMILGVISMTIKLEKKLMSLRTKEALKAKVLKGEKLGKPLGTIQKSKFDLQKDKIEELLNLGLSVRKIAKLLNYNNHIGLNNYVKKRNIRKNLSSQPNSLL